MRLRTIPGLVLAGLLLSTTVSQAFGQDSEKPAPKVAPARPAVQLRLAKLDDLIGDLRYVVKKLGREEEGKQFEEMLKARTGPKGLEGVDTTKPIGLVGTIAKRFDESEVLFLLPIADEKTFMTFLDNIDLKPKKEKDGSFTMSLENVPFPVLFRFANGYLYGTLKFTATTALAPADKLPKPDDALGTGTGIASLSLNLEAVPISIRNVIIPGAALQLGNLKDKAIPGATERQKELRDAALDELMSVGKQLIEDGASVKIQFDLDRKADALGLAVHVDGPKGSGLAKDIQSLGARTSLGPSILGKDSVMGGYINLPIPATLRKLLDPVIDELFEMGAKDQDENVKAVLKPSFDALMPSLKADSITMAADFRGPGKGGKYSVVATLLMTKGEVLEKAIKDLLAKVPAEARAAFETDVAKAEGVNIHQFTPKGLGDREVELLGKEKVFLAIRKDALFVTAGEAGLDKIKTTLAAKPTAGKLLHLQLAASKLGVLAEKNTKETKETIAKAFGEKDGDKVSLTLDGGDKLDLRLSMDLAVIKLAFLLQGSKEK